MRGDALAVPNDELMPFFGRLVWLALSENLEVRVLPDLVGPDPFDYIVIRVRRPGTSWQNAPAYSTRRSEIESANDPITFAESVFQQLENNI